MLSKKIKLLHILWSGEIGGTEEYILTLIKYSDYSRYDINLCFLSRQGMIYEEAKRLDNVNVVFVGVRNGYDIKGAFRFAKYLYKEKFDIIHSHMRNFLCTGVMALCSFGVSKVLTHHIGPVDSSLFKRERRFYKLFSGVFKIITAISGTVKKNLINDLDVKPADKIMVVYNGIDLNKFSVTGSVPSDLSDVRRLGRYIIGFVGRMEYYKRPLLLIEIALRLIKKDSKFYFVMVGDGSEMDKCKAIISQSGFEKHFRLLGFRRDIPDILGIFDAMLFTTAGEGFGIVIIEAMAKNIPVFAINDGAVPEIIQHEENGILFDSADPEIIAEQIMKVVEDSALLDRIKEKCSEDVRSRFSIDICVEQMEKIYESLL